MYDDSTVASKRWLILQWACMLSPEFWIILTIFDSKSEKTISVNRQHDCLTLPLLSRIIGRVGVTEGASLLKSPVRLRTVTERKRLHCGAAVSPFLTLFPACRAKMAVDWTPINKRLAQHCPQMGRTDIYVLYPNELFTFRVFETHYSKNSFLRNAFLLCA